MALGARDFGPVYTETIFGRMPVEPYNTFSNLVFLFIIIYFSFLTRLDHRRHPLIVTSLPILTIGFIGGTLFHMTRSHNIWLYLDFLPILILVTLATLAFWKELTGSWPASFALAFIPLFGIRQALRLLPLARDLRISGGYLTSAICVLLPILLHAILRNRSQIHLVFGAALSFGIAIICRIGDKTWAPQYLPMGSHFLWHIFGGVSTFLLMQYIYRSDLIRK